jgi:GNAT superfamily N-acetyltransferase
VNRTQEVPARIRRAGSADLAPLSEFFAGLSVRTRYWRFFAAIAPTPAMLRFLSGGAGNVHAVVAVRGGSIIGHAMAADRAGPGGTMTDIGVVVADAWQGHGLGSALMRTLITAAQERGVTSMTMDVMHRNRQVLAMITSHWPTARTDHGADFATVVVPLPHHQQQRPHAGSGASLPATARQDQRPPARTEPRLPAGRSRVLSGSRRVAPAVVLVPRRQSCGPPLRRPPA